MRRASAGGGDNLILAIDLRYLSVLKDSKRGNLAKEIPPGTAGRFLEAPKYGKANNLFQKLTTLHFGIITSRREHHRRG